LSTESLVSYYRGLVRQVFAGRRLIFVCPLASDLVWQAELLRECDAKPPFILCSDAKGSAPHSVCYEVSVSGADLDDWGGAICEFTDSMPPDLVRALDRYDPDRSALVYEAPDLGSARLLARRRYGRRRARWAAYEDKTRIDAFWDRVGVPHAPCQVIPPSTEAAAAAFRTLNQEAGVVLAGDNTQGIEGGATNIRWVRRAVDVADCVSFFAGRCERIRVSAFMEGIPCTIHGIVFPDDVAVFRPMELLVLRLRSTDRFTFAGTNVFWEPPGTGREPIRELMRRIGGHLRAEAGYRGGFTMDGIMTRDGFRPTELNARFGTGIGDGHPIPGLPLFMVQCLALEAAEFGTVIGPFDCATPAI
jgi:hypothetical protein